ncbi:MAG: YcxB family protein, partial [Clostridiaceae bacterium]|nr:YcxB family protein [Clostridiaceae bacterium]
MYHMTHSTTLKKSLFVQRYVLSLIFLIIPFIVAKITNIPLWYWLTIFTIYAVLRTIFYPKFFKNRMSKRLLKMVNEGKNMDMLGNRKLSLTEEGIINITKVSESKTRWDAIESIEETEKYIFIYISSVSAYIIPI